MKKVLITGITGFVGKHLATHLLSQQSYEVVGTYRSATVPTTFGEIQDKITLKKLDCTNAQSVEEIILSEKPDIIYHLAAQASPSKSFGSPVETLTNNIIAEYAILEALKKHNLIQTKVLIVSTGEIYGIVSPSDIPVDEETPLRPASPYAVSKIAQDYLSLQYFLAYKLSVIRVRPFNHIGPGQRTGFVVADFAKQIAEIEKGKQRPVITVGNLAAKRDFTDVRDMVKAYELAIEKGVSGEVYNIGSGKSREIRKLLETLLSLSNEKITVTEDPELFRPIDVPEILCDNRKFHKLTGWETAIPFEKTLQDILDYWRAIV